MNRLIIVVLLVTAGLYFVNSYETQVDKLMKPVASAPAGGTGIQKITLDSRQHSPESDVVYGAFTILYFYSNSCPGCRRLNTDLRQFVKVRPDVAVRKFDLGYHWSGKRAYDIYHLKIEKTPFIVIYGPDGNLIVRDEGMGDDAFHLLYAWINAELRQAWNRREG